MNMAIISDIHGNMDALKAVLADIDALGIGRIYSLGDNIGYGPEPLAVVQCMQQRDIPSVLGNHEWALIDRRHLKWFNPGARKSLMMNVEMLDEAAIEYSKQLEKSMTVANCRLVHGFAPKSVTLYLFQIRDNRIVEVLSRIPEDICFVGHTHTLDLVASKGRNFSRQTLKKGKTKLKESYKYIVNVGSVGQPRDGNNNAKYVLWDTDTRILEVRHVPYDIAATVKKIEDAGLPSTNASRLW